MFIGTRFLPGRGRSALGSMDAEYFLRDESKLPQFLVAIEETQAADEDVDHLLSLATKCLVLQQKSSSMLFSQASAALIVKCGWRVGDHQAACNQIVTLVFALDLPKLPCLGIFWCCVILRQVFLYNGTQLSSRAADCLEVLAPVGERISAETLWKRYKIAATGMVDVAEDKESAASCIAPVEASQSSHCPTPHHISCPVPYCNSLASITADSASTATLSAATLAFGKHGFDEILQRLLSEIPQDARSDARGLVFDVWASYFYNLAPHLAEEPFDRLIPHFDAAFEKARKDATRETSSPWITCASVSRCLSNASLACPQLSLANGLLTVERVYAWIELVISKRDCGGSHLLRTCLLLLRTLVHVLFQSSQQCDAPRFKRYIEACACLCHDVEDYIELGDVATGLYHRCDREDGKGNELMVVVIKSCLSPIKRRGIEDAQLPLSFESESGVWPMSHTPGGDTLAGVFFRVVADVEQCLVHWLGAYWLGDSADSVCETIRFTTGANREEALFAIDQLCRGGMSPSAAVTALCEELCQLDGIGMGRFLLDWCTPRLSDAVVSKKWRNFFNDGELDLVLKREFQLWCEEWGKPSPDDVKQWYYEYVQQALDLDRDLYELQDDLEAALTAGQPVRLRSAACGSPAVAAVTNDGADYAVAAHAALMQLDEVPEGKVRLFHGCSGQAVMAVLSRGLQAKLCDSGDFGRKGAFYLFETYIHAASHAGKRGSRGHGEGINGRPMVMIFEVDGDALQELQYEIVNDLDYAATVVFAARHVAIPQAILSKGFLRETLRLYRQWGGPDREEKEARYEACPTREVERRLLQCMTATSDRIGALQWVAGPLWKSYGRQFDLKKYTWHEEDANGRAAGHPELRHLNPLREERLVAARLPGNVIGQIAVKKQQGFELFETSLIAVVALPDHGVFPV